MTIEAPQTHTDARGETTITHPAFAQISAGRVSAQPGVALYGSDYPHRQYMRITISRSSIERRLSNDWHHASGELIEVMMTEAQWGRFVSSANIGDGTPCTLGYIHGVRVPDLPRPEPKSQDFAEDMAKQLAEAATRLAQLYADIESMKAPKNVKDRLMVQIENINNAFGGNLEFVAEQFGEFMEESKEAAKVEVGAYMQQVLKDAGLNALTSNNPLVGATENKPLKSLKILRRKP